jgi:hypothetical protein
VTATVGRQSGSVSFIFSYSAGFVSGLFAQIQSTGASALRLFANSVFYQYSSGFSVRGHTVFGFHSWISSSSVSLKSFQGAGRVSSLVVSAAIFSRIPFSPVFSMVFSYFQYSINVQNPGLSAGTGGIQLLVDGREFGVFESTVRLRCFSTPFDASYWISSSSLVCKKPSFSGAKITVTALMTIASEKASFSSAFMLLYPALGTASTASFPSSGAAIVHFFGSDMGTRDSSLRSKIGSESFSIKLLFCVVWF